MYNSCAVFGHSKIIISLELKEKLKSIFEELVINDNVGVFYFGGLGQFDDLCYQTISELKIKYPHIRRIFCVSDPRWVRWDKRPQWLKNEVYEEVVYLDLKYDYWYTRIYYRNCEIINQSDIVVFYVKTK